MSEKLVNELLGNVGNAIRWVQQPCRYCGHPALFPESLCSKAFLEELTANFSPPYSKAAFPDSWACCDKCERQGMGRGNYGKPRELR